MKPDPQTLTVAPRTFFNGSEAYNVASFGIGLFGVVLGAVALWLALRQLKRMVEATEAAEQAVADSQAQLRAMGAVVDLSRATRMCNELIVLVRHKDLRSAALRALDLRETLAMVRVSKGGSGLAGPEEWQALLTRVGSLQDQLEAAKAAADAAPFSQSIAAIHQDMASLQQRLVDSAGDT